jgi:DnaJ-class molecular chaperone
MGSQDYYTILDLKKDCSSNDIKKAYHQLALHWHPESNTNPNKEFVQDKFRSIAEAYTVLSDVKLRTIFDQYGSRGLQEGVSNSSGGKVPPWSYTANPEEQFADFFGSVSPFADFFSGDSGLDMPIFPDKKVPKAGKVASQVINLYCSLEELYEGCTKKVKVTTQKLHLDGKSVNPETKVMTVDVQAGWREGTKIRFTGGGDEQANMSTGDIVFVLKEKPHPRFQRAKNNLIYKASITLSQALCGTIVEVLTLDRRTVPISVTDMVRPNTPKIVPNEGMPIPNGGGKGNLIIEFDIQFPDMLSETQKTRIAEVLG